MTRFNREPLDVPESLWHGYSVFTTVRLEAGEPIWLPEHMSRLKNHAEALGIGFPGFEKLEREVAHYKDTGLLRLSLTPEGYASSLRPLRLPGPEQYQNGVEVKITQWRIHPDLGRYKTGNYLPYRLALQEAQNGGAFEGLLLDAEGFVVDGSRTSPLLYQEHRLLVLQGGLEGITRKKVAEYARTIGLEIEEVFLKPDQLEGQLLLAGTGVGLLSVGKPLDSVLKHLIAEFQPHIL